MKKQKKKYPILAIRMTDDEINYIRREAHEKNMKISKYVKAVLAPSWAIDGKEKA